MRNPLLQIPGTVSCQPDIRELPLMETSPLPAEHRAFLEQANGVSALHGYYRLFGLGCSGCTDLSSWNDRETWKFAWPPHVADFLAFGETAWGDQFAYSIAGLGAGDSTVFLLDSFEMQPEPIAAGFDEFMANEFVRCASSPYDSMTRAALARIGPLKWDEHVTYVPSLLLGGTEDAEHIRKVPARASMIINGDIATQCAEAPDRSPASVETYEDARRRTRLRIHW